ncbi:MAG: hypothetical protein L0Z62_07140 [Gemmataceae bacterium]|nr:hypothetical protein [Gemmataceae bacterium]
MNALARPEVGRYLDDHFVSSFQKVGTFRLAGNKKQGGNVASYFTTPSGRVLHVLAGPVNAQVMLREARWVVETWKLAQLQGNDKSLPRMKTFLRKAHSDRLRQEYRMDVKKVTLPSDNPTPAALAAALNPPHGKARGKGKNVDRQGRVHLLLVSYPLPRIEQVYTLVFQRLLNENLSTAPVVQKG